MSQRSHRSDDYTPDRLYHEAFTLECDWEANLPSNVFKFHDLIWQEFNSPIALQMGILLPFISSICGPSTRCKYMTRPSVCNLFWLNVSASGSGKSQCRSMLVSECLEYIMNHSSKEVYDFEVSRYTRAGLEDKLITCKGYCCLVSDEATGFFDDICRKNSKHESDLSLLNQLYDGRGDKTTLAQNRERAVPRNSTSISLSIQQEGFITALDKLGKQMWMDSGFGERFIMSAVRPYRFKYDECEIASMERNRLFDELLLPKICLEIFEYHFEANITYTFGEDAKKLYKEIFDTYNAQYNLKYARLEDLPASQQDLNFSDRAEISVRTKAPELIGRLSCILWVYCQAFECVVGARPFTIPTVISREYVEKAQDIISTSYSQSETFSTAIFFGKPKYETTPIQKPLPTDKGKVISALIKWPTPVANVRNMTKNIRAMTTPLVKNILMGLEKNGIGRLVSRSEMIRDKHIPHQQCSTVFMKPEITYLPESFFDHSTCKETDRNSYIENFQKPMDAVTMRIVVHYHPNKDLIPLVTEVTPSQAEQSSTLCSEVQRRKERHGYKRKRTALDDLAEEFDKADRIEQGDLTQSPVRRINPEQSSENDQSDFQETSQRTSKVTMDHTQSKKGRKFIPRKKIQEVKNEVVRNDGSESLFSASEEESDSIKFIEIHEETKVIPSSVQVRVVNYSDSDEYIEPSQVVHDSSQDEEDTASDGKGVFEEKPSTSTHVDSVTSHGSQQTTTSTSLKGSLNLQPCKVDLCRPKTSRWHRPKKEECKVKGQPVRHSKRIKALKEEEWKKQQKMISTDSSSTETSTKNVTSGKKRKLSKSARDSRYSKK